VGEIINLNTQGKLGCMGLMGRGGWRRGQNED